MGEADQFSVVAPDTRYRIFEAKNGVRGEVALCSREEHKARVDALMKDPKVLRAWATDRINNRIVYYRMR